MFMMPQSKKAACIMAELRNLARRQLRQVAGNFFSSRWLYHRAAEQIFDDLVLLSEWFVHMWIALLFS